MSTGWTCTGRKPGRSGRTGPYPGLPRDWVQQALEAMLLYDPDQVYLFGSVVRAEDTVDSDIDLLVAVDRAPLERWSEWRSALRFTARYFCPYRVNVFITDLEDLVRRRHIVTSPCKWVADEGRLIYDRQRANEFPA